MTNETFRKVTKDDLINALKNSLVGYVKKLDDGWEFILDKDLNEIADELISWLDIEQPSEAESKKGFDLEGLKKTPHPRQ